MPAEPADGALPLSDQTLVGDAAFARAEQEIVRSRAGAIELLDEFVRVPTVNPPGRHYLEFALLLAQRLRDLGFAPRLIDVPARELARLGHDPAQPRPAVLAELGPEGAADGGSSDLPALHFHGHYDVVPAEAPDLFRLAVDGDEARGRGAADMKGGLVALLLALAALRPLARRLRGRVILSVVPDEETGGAAGTEQLFRSGALPGRSLGMLMPEPTGEVIWNGNRGALSLLATVRGRMAHVALQHEGRNAFEGMLALGAQLLELKREIESRRFDAPDLGIAGPPSVLLLGGTCGGGINFNVVPDAVRFSLDRRFHPAESGEAAEKELEGLFRRFRRQGWALDIEWLLRGDASLTAGDAPLARAMAATVQAVTGRAPRFTLCPGILETRFFLRHGTPGLAYGPGELACSHGPEERVRLSRILEVARVYARMAWTLLGTPRSTGARA